MNFKIDNIDSENIKKAARLHFPEAYFHLDKTDLFMKGVEDGEYSCDFLDHTLYVSTQYAYEDIMVKQNPTRYKLSVHTLELLDSEYNVNYSWKDRYFVIYEEHNELQFMEYGAFLEKVKESIQAISK